MIEKLDLWGGDIKDNQGNPIYESKDEAIWGAISYI